MDTNRWFICHFISSVIPHIMLWRTAERSVLWCFCRNFGYLSFLFLSPLSFHFIYGSFGRNFLYPSDLFCVVTICQHTTNAWLKTLVLFNHKKFEEPRGNPPDFQVYRWSEMKLFDLLTRLSAAADVCAACLHHHYMSYQVFTICGFPHLYRSTFPTLASSAIIG